jgi:hypothetical protein
MYWKRISETLSDSTALGNTTFLLSLAPANMTAKKYLVMDKMPKPWAMIDNNGRLIVCHTELTGYDLYANRVNLY